MVINCRLSNNDLEIKDADDTNVVWEVLIERTNNKVVDFTLRELNEAIETTNASSRVTFEIYPKSKDNKAPNDSKENKKNKGNKTKKESSSYCSVAKVDLKPKNQIS